MLRVRKAMSASSFPPLLAYQKSKQKRKRKIDFGGEIAKLLELIKVSKKVQKVCTNILNKS